MVSWFGEVLAVKGWVAKDFATQQIEFFKLSRMSKLEGIC
jgi:hypothetical protein